ncbi:MAG TPA: hypothetical protein ENI76_02820 [Ignavibacteria bacterium]|nr:hypothetical protein [Ignavibacteria bacterium]
MTIIGGVGVSIGFGAYSNLTVKPNIINSAYQLDIDADSITLSDGLSIYDALSVNLTTDITVTGANGRDAGSEANSIWYGVYVIYNGITVASLLSTSFTAPTMPSGYTYKRFVGAVRNDGSGNFLDFIQRGNYVYYISAVDIASGLAQLTYTAQDVSAVFPTASGRVASMQIGGYAVTTWMDVFLSANGGVNTHSKFGAGINGNIQGSWVERYVNWNSSSDFMPWISGNNIHFEMDNITARTYTMQGLAYYLNL